MPRPQQENIRTALLRLAHDLLAGTEGNPVEPIEVTVRSAAGTVLSLRSQPGEFVGAVESNNHSDLGTLEKAILRTASEEPQTAKKLAGKLKRPCNSYFRDHLRELCRGGLLVKLPEGYQHPPVI